MTIDRFKEIEEEVKSVLATAFKNIASTNFENYIPFLLNGEYDEVIASNTKCGLSPYTIEYTIDGYKDQNRLSFMCDFLNKYYNYSDNSIIQYDSYRINIETMIYTHIWESKPFLKNLHRLAKLINEEEYVWSVKHNDIYIRPNFINNHIIKLLPNSDFKLIIQNSYDNTLRNSLAHSDFLIDEENITFINDRAKGGNPKFFTKTLLEWNECFAYSFNLSYWFMIIKKNMRYRLAEGLQDNAIQLNVFNKAGNPAKFSIRYDKNTKSFYFV